MLILFGVVCGILCGVSDLSGADRKSVRHMGNYSNEVSMSWYSNSHLQRLTGHCDSTTRRHCDNTTSVTGGLFVRTTMTQSWYIPNLGFVIDKEDVLGFQDIW